MNKKILIAGGSIVGLLVIALLSFLIFRPTQEALVIPEIAFAAEEFMETARVDVEEGVLIVQEQGQDDQEVRSGLPLRSGMNFIAEDEAKATFYWPDGSLTRFRGPGELEVTEMLVHPDSMETTVDIEIHSGEAWSKVIDMLTDNSEFTVRTQNTVAGIRGTEVFHRVNDVAEEVVTYDHIIDLRDTLVDRELALPEMNAYRIERKRGAVQSIEGQEEQVMPWLSEARGGDEAHGKQLADKRKERMQQMMVQNVAKEEELMKLAQRKLTPEQQKQVEEQHMKLLFMKQLNGEELSGKEAQELRSLLEKNKNSMTDEQKMKFRAMLQLQSRMKIADSDWDEERLENFRMHKELMNSEEVARREAKELGMELLRMYDELDDLTPEKAVALRKRLGLIEKRLDESDIDLELYHWGLLQEIERKLNMQLPQNERLENLEQRLEKFEKFHDYRLDTYREERLAPSESSSVLPTRQPVTRTPSTSTTSTSTSEVTTNTDPVEPVVEISPEPESPEPVREVRDEYSITR